jgi:hypothetical protein
LRAPSSTLRAGDGPAPGAAAGLRVPVVLVGVVVGVVGLLV